MRWKNTDNHFGIVAISLHWVMAVIMIGLLGYGLYMVRLPISIHKLRLYGWHKEFGLLILLLAVIRLGWRVSHVTPHLDLPWYEKFAARLVHWAFYGFMFAMPITGWLITSSAGLPASFFGLVTFPNLVAPNEQSRQLFQFAHQWIAYGCILTICMHASAALKHHFINKDDILRRML